jgi:hypothetical protein
MLALGQAEGQTFHARVAASSSSVSVDTCSSSIGGCLSAPLASLWAACPACACPCLSLDSPKSRGNAPQPIAISAPPPLPPAPDAPAPLPPASPLPPCSPLPAASR